MGPRLLAWVEWDLLAMVEDGNRHRLYCVVSEAGILDFLVPRISPVIGLWRRQKDSCKTVTIDCRSIAPIIRMLILETGLGCDSFPSLSAGKWVQDLVHHSRYWKYLMCEVSCRDPVWHERSLWWWLFERQSRASYWRDSMKVPSVVCSFPWGVTHLQNR